jgi:UTP--glucose-1-phosphate uridylyltransferase
MASLSSGGGGGGGGSSNNLSNVDLARIARVARNTQAVQAHIAESNLLEPDSLKEFVRLVGLYAKQNEHASSTFKWDKVKPPAAERLQEYGALDDVPEDVDLTHALLDRLVVCKLNGGLGTTMGCRGPKSCLEVDDDRTFLDLTVRQVEMINIRYGVDVPLLLMNSFNTHDETRAYIRKYSEHNIRIHMFQQQCYPRISKDSLLPVATGPFTPDTKHLWYPPGHGDIYASLFRSGLLENLINQGKEYIFISNIDNLSATVDLKVLYHLMNQDTEFCMELVPKSRADTVGGTLVDYQGETRLLEIGEVPKRHRHDLLSHASFRLFNTNNLWVNLRAIQRLCASGSLNSDVIVKQTSGGDAAAAATNSHHYYNGNNSNNSSMMRKMLHLETAAGAAVKCFAKSLGLKVPRSRFRPVKTTADLLAVQSSLYSVKHGSLVLNALREVPSVPIIKLGPEFKTVHGYMERFPRGVPDIVGLEHLTVSGNVYFGAGVVLKGTVVIVCNEGSRIDIPDHAVLDNVVVTGSLRLISTG